jgi:hypothetical protein
VIPKIIHFIYGLKEDFGGIPFSLVHYIAIKSAYEVNRPEQMNFFFQYEPEGEHWEKAKPYLNLIPVKPPTEIFGNPLCHPAHQSDVMRLMILIQYGGIYLDLDTICVKPFDDLLHHKFVIGQQGTGYHLDGLCNAVLLSEKNARFASVWLSNYKNFRSKGADEFWDEHSILVPLKLCPFFCLSDDVHIEPFTSFHFPHYDIHLEKLFAGDHEFPKAYCHHLWESLSWDRYLKNLSIDHIQSVDSYYNRIAKKILDNK